MVHNLSQKPSLLTQWVAELRNVSVQQDRMRFRRNLERIAEVMGYELSKELPYKTEQITTPMGISDCNVLSEQPVLATILRAGLGMHNGLLNFFDGADNAFLSAYRKHHANGSFEIRLQYMSCPPIEGKILILSDPMLATGASLVKSVEYLRAEGAYKKLHIVCAIACTEGLDFVKKNVPEATIWCAAIDDELTAKGYIVPGLGDAGDLAYGTKVQQ